MNVKTLRVLEYPKILDRLSRHCDFSASAELARALEPSIRLEEIQRLQADTSEASRLLCSTDATIGGAHDIRTQVDLARHAGVLEPQALLDIQSTLLACRLLKKIIEKNSAVCPRLAEISVALLEPPGLVEAISRTVSEDGEVLDSASPRLGLLRNQVRLAHSRLTTRLQRYLTDSTITPLLQDALITQRDGRYVLPLRAEFKGRIKSIIHDQSSTGATLFVEPLAVVELNNQYREVQLAERDQVRRVLAELSLLVGEHAETITWGIQALAELDLAFAKAKYSIELSASEPILRQIPNSANPKTTAGHFSPSVVNLYQARHPLLDASTVVPIDVILSPEIHALVITGPNTGGKTVSLKTVGLLVLMAQTGLHIPARSGSELPVFNSVYADIGDEQSIEQSLSTFSGHITNIIQILKVANERSLVILDELGAGTDPQEGSALARAILTHLLERRTTTFVATHYPELKTYAQVTPGVVNASLEFDIRTLRPTYRLTIGLPGRSNAMAIAQRLGLPETILETARREVPADNLRSDKLLDDIHRQRNIARKEREKAEKARIDAHRLRRELTERLEQIDDERQTILEQAQSQAAAQIEALQTEARNLKRQLQRAGQPLELLKVVEKSVQALEEKADKPIDVQKTKPKRITHIHRPLSVGEKVTLRTLKTDGVVTALGEEDVEVQIGSLRVRAKLADIQRRADDLEEENEPGKPATQNQEKSPRDSRPSFAALASPGMEIDLRGQNSEDALEALERYLDQAYLVGMPFVRIIHGKGTGKLRQVIRAALKESPHVGSFEEGGDKEGGAGVTVAKIAS